MLIDLSTLPITVLPHAVPNILAVRHMGKGGRVVDWKFTRKQSRYSDVPRGAYRLTSIDPGAQLTRGDYTLYETALPLNVPYCAACNDKGCPQCAHHWAMYRRDKRPAGVKILPDPWEVPTYSRNLLKNEIIMWRAGVQTEKLDDDAYRVTFYDYTRYHEHQQLYEYDSPSEFDDRLAGGLPLVSLVSKEVKQPPRDRTNLPLNTKIKETLAFNAWSQLLIDDD